MEEHTINVVTFWCLIASTYVVVEALANVVFFSIQQKSEKSSALDSLFQLGRLVRLACGILILWCLYVLVE